MSIIIYILSVFFVITIPIYILRKIIEYIRSKFDKIIDKYAERTADHIVKKLNNHKKL